MKETVLSQITQCEKMNIKQLKEKYIELFKTSEGIQSNKPYLVRKIAFKLQEREYGGLSETTKNRLNELIQEHDPINNIEKVFYQPAQTPAAKIKRDRRLPMPGSVITKEYKGNIHSIKVLEKGFEYNNKVFKSLTAVAEEITGAHWNGYMFFGIR